MLVTTAYRVEVRCSSAICIAIRLILGIRLLLVLDASTCLFLEISCNGHFLFLCVELRMSCSAILDDIHVLRILSLIVSVGEGEGGRRLFHLLCPKLYRLKSLS